MTHKPVPLREVRYDPVEKVKREVLILNRDFRGFHDFFPDLEELIFLLIPSQAGIDHDARHPSFKGAPSRELGDIFKDLDESFLEIVFSLFVIAGIFETTGEKSS